MRLRLEAAHTLHIESDDAPPEAWPVAEISVSPRLGSTPRILRFAGGGQIECQDSPLLEAWFPTRRESRVEAFADWLERRRTAIVAAAAVTVLATVAFVKFGVPWIATRVAEHMPASVEHHLTSQVVAMLEKTHFHPTAIAAERQARLRVGFADLVRGEPRADQMQVVFVASPSIGPNAFALPDGRIYITDQLVALADDDDELLSVLAHEAGHHVHRHGMRLAIESSSVLVATGLMFGDVSGSSIAVAVPAALLNSGFSREHEREADAYAIDLLKRRRVAPTAFARMLRRLEQDQRNEPGGVVGYLSTHPPTPERIRAAEAAAAGR
ncbi:M48 family metallopeptidase [Lysobacter sp. KIS68-7]|uniref:M48 family metallopeptidase n=1 Tax=Lysobacter sp. KIS68-7 TaxID=2904252 RepID=UPI001E2F0A97|nr:M48 family metallopeptidase [Lysobacter sp. KIS68-7]UHQ18603.1 M48 family metallopeptidase [Lysobacter sp. KIS68-7]